VFKLYDEQGVYITEKAGVTFIPPGKVVPIFESNLQVGGRKPVHTNFKFTQQMVWRYK